MQIQHNIVQLNTASSNQKILKHSTIKTFGLQNVRPLKKISHQNVSQQFVCKTFVNNSFAKRSSTIRLQNVSQQFICKTFVNNSFAKR